MTDTKERIVRAAAIGFQRQGYAGTGLKQVSAESQAPFGSLYHFFPGGKVELAAETLRWAGRGYQELVEAIWDTSPNVVAAVRSSFDAAAETLRDTDYADACPIATVALEVASTHEELRQVTAEIFAGWLDALTMRLADAGISKRRSRELAVEFLAALEGGFLLSRAAKDTAPMTILGRSVAVAVREALATAGRTRRR